MVDAQDRNLPATLRRIAKAKADGQVARSRDLGHLLPLALGGAALLAFAPQATRWAAQLLMDGLRFDAQTLSQTQTMAERLGASGVRLLAAVLPMGLLMAAAAVLAATLSGGWNFTWKPLAPNASKLNPIAGVGRLASKAHLIETLKAVTLALILAAIGALYLRAQIDRFHDALAMPSPTALAHTVWTVLLGIGLLALALALFALIDVPLQRHLFLQRLKMSHEEARQEFKELEGNVEVKAKVKARMREIVKRRMLTEVPRADLVVMNPTHYAVALKYDESTMGAPRVVAKGADLLALRIRDLARDAKVPVLRLPPLARALYTHVEIDREVPAQLFAAVAKVLAYVYQLRAALSGRAPMPGELPELDLPPGLDPLEASPAGAGAE
jgi:flagellar biosynthesis protein FlhB